MKLIWSGVSLQACRPNLRSRQDRFSKFCLLLCIIVSMIQLHIKYHISSIWIKLIRVNRKYFSDKCIKKQSKYLLQMVTFWFILNEGNSWAKRKWTIHFIWKSNVVSSAEYWDLVVIFENVKLYYFCLKLQWYHHIPSGFSFGLWESS